MIQLAFLLVAGAGYLIDFTDSPSKRVLAGLVVAGMALLDFLPSAARARQRAPQVDSLADSQTGGPW
jgi:hypothetical protein